MKLKEPAEELSLKFPPLPALGKHKSVKMNRLTSFDQTAGPDLIDKLIYGGDSKVNAFNTRINRLRERHSSQYSRRDSAQSSSSEGCSEGSSENKHKKNNSANPQLQMIHQLKSERHLFKRNKLQLPEEEFIHPSPLPTKINKNKSERKHDDILSQTTQTNQQKVNRKLIFFDKNGNT